MDGGSTDNSIEVIREYEEQAKNVRIGPDGGQTHAIAAGFHQIPEATHLLWLNSDDRLLPGALSTLARMIKREPRHALYIGAGWQISGDGRRRLVLRDEIRWPTVRLWPQQYFLQPATMISRPAYEAVMGVNPDVLHAMDYDLGCACSTITPPNVFLRQCVKFKCTPNKKRPAFAMKFFGRPLHCVLTTVAVKMLYNWAPTFSGMNPNLQVGRPKKDCSSFRALVSLANLSQKTINGSTHHLPRGYAVFVNGAVRRLPQPFEMAWPPLSGSNKVPPTSTACSVWLPHRGMATGFPKVAAKNGMPEFRPRVLGTTTQSAANTSPTNSWSLNRRW